MKNLKIVLTVFALVVVLTSCEHKVVMNTTVHVDGSIDKTIVMEGDSANMDNNFIGIGSLNGWNTTILKKDTVKNTDQGKFMLTFTKHFNSSEEANLDLAMPNDTLFRVTSRFDKRFRWFYTYVRYSDTYHAINRLHEPIEDYFTEEDFDFINRLPAEGSPISKADSLYFDRLNDKIFDVYGTHALIEEYYQRLVNLLKSENKIAWTDTLKHYRKKLFESIDENKDADDFSDLIKKVGIPKLPVADKEINKLEQEMKALTDFISISSNGKYVHSIAMPYSHVVYSNADSIAGSTLFWLPSSTKFLLKDFEMVGEARTLNIWTLVISVGFILMTVIIVLYKRRSQSN